MGAPAVFSSLVPLIVVASMRRAEERIHRQLVDARAFTAESAIPLSLSRSFDRRRLVGLVGGGAVRQAADDLYFLDAEGWDKCQRDRRRRVLIALSVVLVLIGALAIAFLVMR